MQAQRAVFLGFVFHKAIGMSCAGQSQRQSQQEKGKGMSHADTVRKIELKFNNSAENGRRLRPDI